MNKKAYVLGFMFNETKDKVLLIKKNRPDYQKGKLNGLGGKIEKLREENGIDVFESPLVAMTREFEEECGIKYTKWEKFCELLGNGWGIDIYRAFGDITQAKTTTDEEICIVDVKNLPKNVMSNLNWIIPMALEKDFYIVEEF